MSLFGKKKKRKPKTEEAMMQEMLADIGQSQDAKDKRRKRRGKRLLPAWVDHRLFIGLAIIVIAVIADGVRRENQEFYAEVTKVYGPCMVHDSVQSPGATLEVGANLSNRNVVRTGAQSSVVMEFPDGSVVTVGPSSTLVVKMLEYNRGGAWRTRSFFLQAGQIWARVSPHFGSDSNMKVYTPSSVAAVRGTTFSVYQAPSGKSSDITCVQGNVEAQGFIGAPELVAPNSQTKVNVGKSAPRTKRMSDAQAGTFNQVDLFKEIPQEHWLKVLELTITQTLDAPLNILGIGKCSWGVGAANFARRTTALEALRLLHQHIEGHAQFPEYINPATIEELGIPAQHSRRILSVFDGDAIELYRRSGRGFILFARARDNQRTLYKLTPYGPQSATEAELREARISG